MSSPLWSCTLKCTHIHLTPVSTTSTLGQAITVIFAQGYLHKWGCRWEKHGYWYDPTVHGFDGCRTVIVYWYILPWLIYIHSLSNNLLMNKTHTKYLGGVGNSCKVSHWKVNLAFFFMEKYLHQKCHTCFYFFVFGLHKFDKKTMM